MVLNHLMRIVLTLTLCLVAVQVSAFEAYFAAQELPADMLIVQQEITTSGMSALALKIIIPERFPPGVPDRVAIRSSWRWFPYDPSTTNGDRVAWLRIDRQFIGPKVFADSCPNCLSQSGNSLPYTATLLPGPHTIELVFGGCCGISGHPFWVGAGSRLEAIW